MRHWFLSYHSPDQALAERLKAALERKDTDAHVFFAPSSLRAGGLWSRALAEEIAQADAFILLVGERGVGDWQVLEYDEALDKRVKFPDFPVILLLLQGQTAPGLPFLRRLHWIITPDPSSEKDLARLLDAASGSSTRSGDLWRYTSPYRGLAAMEEKDSDYFFGRERETIDVLSRSPWRWPAPGVARQFGRRQVLVAQAACWRRSSASLARGCRYNARVATCLSRKPPLVLSDAQAGTEPLKALVEAFLDTWRLGSTIPSG
jgi:hypothetical protein